MVGEHLNVRLALRLRVQRPSPAQRSGRRLPAKALLLLFCSLPQCLPLLWQQAILWSLLGNAPGGVARGNRAIESLSNPHLELWELFVF